MTAEDMINRSFAEHIKIMQTVNETLVEAINQVGQILARSLSSEGTIFWCGNGGSAADSQHLAAELVGRFKKDRRALRSIALSTDTSILTCVANDYSYEEIFSRQIEALGRSEDILVVISTSGNSENVLRALESAKTLGLISVALLGTDGGLCKDKSDYSIIVPSQNTARIQEAHILIGHILCEQIEKELMIG